jgi:hypothetical protein
MATFPVDNHVYNIISTMPDVQPSVLQAACDPASPPLLAWPIYRGIIAACGAGEAEAKAVFARFLAAKAEHEGTDLPDPPVRGRLDLAAVAHAQASGVPMPPHAEPPDSAAPAPPSVILGAGRASVIDPPTVPKLRLPPGLARRPSRRATQPPPRLREITGKADFARYVKGLISESCLTLRTIEERTRALNPGAVSCRSTLSDNLRHDRVPANEAVMETLLEVLYDALATTVPAAARVRRSTAEALQVWRHVMRPPQGAPVLVASAGYEPLVRTALATLARAEQNARDVGSPDAPGLGHARRILLELFT